MAAAYEKIGDVQGQPRQANLGDPDGAAGSYKRALAIRESLASANPTDLEVRRQLVPNYAKLSDLLWSMGDPPRAMEYSEKHSFGRVAIITAPSLSCRPLPIRNLSDGSGYKQAVVAGDRAEGSRIFAGFHHAGADDMPKIRRTCR